MTMTANERIIWSDTHRDYRTTIDGVPHVLVMIDGATKLCPLPEWAKHVAAASAAYREQCAVRGAARAEVSR